MNRMLFVFILLYPSILLGQEVTIDTFEKDSIEIICKEEQVIYMTKQTDDTFSATLKADLLDEGSFNIYAPDDSLTFRLYHPYFSPDFSYENRIKEEVLENLPDRLNFDCNFLEYHTYVLLFAVHMDGSVETCVSKTFVIDTTETCLDEGVLTKICVTQIDNTPVSDVIIAWSDGFSGRAENVLQEGCVFMKTDTSKFMNLFKIDEIDLGISTFDLLLIKKYILGIAPFENEAQFLAADVNNTGTITAKDLLDLKRIILGQRNFFPNNSPWRFFPRHWLSEGFDWQNLELGFYLWFDPKKFTGKRFEFIAVKVGDVSSVSSF